METDGTWTFMKQCNTNSSMLKRMPTEEGALKQLPELGRHETDHQASGSKRTSATDTQCAQIPAAPTARSATFLDPAIIIIIIIIINHCHHHHYNEELYTKLITSNYIFISY